MAKQPSPPPGRKIKTPKNFRGGGRSPKETKQVKPPPPPPPPAKKTE